MNAETNNKPDKQEKAARKVSSKLFQLVCPKDVADEIRFLCRRNCVSQTRLITLALRHFIEYVESQDIQEDTQANPRADFIPSRDMLNEKLNFPTTTLPADSWAAVDQEDVLHAAEDEPFDDEE